MNTPPWPNRQPYGPPPPAAGFYGPQPYAGPTGGPADDVRLAGFGRRLGARVIDFFVLSVISVVLLFILMISVFIADPGAAETTSAAFDTTLGFIIVFGWGVVVFFYDWLFHVGWGKTVGKAVLSIKVVGVSSGRRPTQGQAIGRAAFFGLPQSLPCLGQLIALLDCLWPLFDERSQALHDKVSRTIVVHDG
ncbi:putative RDD family membrane protein YckC [Spinactinospora alkalitolerans]|uniref:Putative RDD family membrane protein YckC n=1 Tax=Spinactinospora alkalitolerans TaxID=687207 RepID=A0A852TPR0_9ACTN|nr:RDD family protein [Spinactinospora alkalitolerans]NYE45595.1 putative RDD family membrane protein YckC [Spinactinospora alkalitolerans]